MGRTDEGAGGRIPPGGGGLRLRSAAAGAGVRGGGGGASLRLEPAGALIVHFLGSFI